jgi:hypothetical protein
MALSIRPGRPDSPGSVSHLIMTSSDPMKDRVLAGLDAAISRPDAGL